ncbi:MAG: hypothetical protein US63_C0003G0012 [Candidatus Moranbacteria bacterium GW2011_GWC2_37_8]|nr:MAG: hypothetical protein US63_C0003G0012 [Candidatus Moranbacteria bacterium GW2011_GWC2_37_8]KKQ63217.1 MAG: hypothetical protein US82_C0002G0012 [Parcubacteria group bacterium GW2011_GWC1_38_22]
MLGSADNRTLRNVFSYVEMPATMKQLDDRARNTGNEEIVYRIIKTRLGNGVIEDGNGYWLSKEIIDEGIANVQEEIDKYQKYLDYLKAQRDKLELQNIK